MAREPFCTRVTYERIRILAHAPPVRKVRGAHSHRRRALDLAEDPRDSLLRRFVHRLRFGEPQAFFRSRSNNGGKVIDDAYESDWISGSCPACSRSIHIES